jgi:hypothetical protein
LNPISYVCQCYFRIWHFCLICFYFTYMENLGQQMSIYNPLLLCHHNFDYVVLRI